jgi:hypothetical protein
VGRGDDGGGDFESSRERSRLGTVVGKSSVWGCGGRQ